MTYNSLLHVVEDTDEPRVVAPPGDPLPNAGQFARDAYGHPERLLLTCHGGLFYSWNGTCWRETEAAALRARLYDYFGDAAYEDPESTEDPPALKPFRPTTRKIADLLDALRAVAHLDRDVTAPTWLHGAGPVPADEVVATANGLLHVPTRTLHEHTPQFYVHHAVPFDFDAQAPAPERWLAFLSELWPDDPEAIEALQQMFGYLLAGDTSLQKMFLLVGPKRSGKGTIARVLTALLGPHNVAGSTLSSLATDFGLAPLIGRPLSIVSDARLQSGQSALIERLLSVSGEDTLTVNRKYLDHWTGRLPTRFLLLSNELPRLADTSGALASRFVVFTMTRSFFGRENPRLTDELTDELPGILNWALDGLDQLRKVGRLTEPASSADAVRELEDLSSPVGAFVRDCCEVGPGHEVTCDDLYAAWRSWCDDHGRDRPGTQQTFGRDIRATVPGLKVTQPRTDDGGRERRYQGIALRDQHNGVDRVPPRANGPEPALARDGTRTEPLCSPHDQTGQVTALPSAADRRTGCVECGDETHSVDPDGRSWCADHSPFGGAA